MLDDKEAWTIYEWLFADDVQKARAFDKLAEHFFIRNFSTFSKTEIDLIMFSEYLERCYEHDDGSGRDYSDYSLSKVLGITQGRVRSLKERKEIKYPSSYDWRQAFLNVLDKAEYHTGKVRLYIRDRRLYTELCNVIEARGNYSETTLTRQLLVMTPPAFVDLMLDVAGDDSQKEAMQERLCEILKANGIVWEPFDGDKRSLSEILRASAPDTASNIIVEAIGLLAPPIGPLASTAARSLLEAIRHAYESKARG